MNERGAATVTTVAVVAVAVVLCVAIADGAVLLATRFQAGNAADAAALAAAPVTFQPFGAAGGPAAEAGRFARLNGAELVSCTCRIDRTWSPRIVEVVVAREAHLSVFGSVRVHVTARAEFIPTALIE